MDANLLAGMTARLQADYPTAVKHFEAAHLLSPADPLIVNNLALALIEMPDDLSHQRALQFAELNLRQNPNGIEQLSGYGWIAYRLGRRADADRALGAAYKASLAAHDNKISAEMNYYLAALHAASGNLANATSLLRTALNSTAPFAYRKPAQELLDKLKKLAAQNAEADPAAASSGP